MHTQATAQLYGTAISMAKSQTLSHESYLLEPLLLLLCTRYDLLVPFLQLVQCFFCSLACVWAACLCRLKHARRDGLELIRNT